MLDVLELVNRLGIGGVVRKGPRVWAPCPHPDHNDVEPSWFIRDQEASQYHATFKCFGCGWKGGPRELVSVVLAIGDDEAQEWLDDNVERVALGVTLEISDEVKAPTFRLPSGCDERPLAAWPTYARRYLERRGFGADTVERWRLSVATTGRLEGRIVIPIFDEYGELISYTARTFLDDSIRYLTPGASAVVRKPLFGAMHWPPMAERERVIVVEGGFDGLAIDAATRLPFGALLGSEPQPAQLLALSTFREVVILTDADKAGSHAAELLSPLRRWAKVTHVELPNDEDPASVFARDPRELASLVSVRSIGHTSRHVVRRDQSEGVGVGGGQECR